MWKRDDPQVSPGTTPADLATPINTATMAPGRTATPRTTGQPARIGSTLNCEGKLNGEEDLVVDGRFRGEIQVPAHMVTIGTDGKVEGEVLANAIVVEGEVRGNLVATEQVLVRASGKVHGDIRAPRVALDQGCRFKGAIDMEPQGRPADVALPRRDTRADNANDRQQRTVPPPAAISS
jgi:cytoskeletal protein CcmA (bactofilin family)